MFERKRHTENSLAGINKKSFALFFAGGEIWAEHLDAMYDQKELVLEKFHGDLSKIQRPSSPGLVVINLDETVVDMEIAEDIISSLAKSSQYLRKVVFVGLGWKNRIQMKKLTSKYESEIHFIINYVNDYEKAKLWLVHNRE